MSKTTGKRLARDHGLSFRHALYRESGDWYHILNEFPGALFDREGYVAFNNKAEYDQFIKLANRLE
jgi:hypothetical protein